ncbi:MAG: hypothetical protein K0R71_1695 [Bacillales bacterium]|jgi:uncharacterized protein YvpB|nr:hypothetical protein [Bacillales bacterium]
MKSSIKNCLRIGLVVASFLCIEFMGQHFSPKENVKNENKQVKYETAKVEEVNASVKENEKIEEIIIVDNQIKNNSTTGNTGQEGVIPSINVSDHEQKYIIPGVPMVQQRPELPTGCEITSVTMMLLYAGFKVDKCELAVEMPYDKSDPNKGFVGDPFKKSGWTIYPSALKGVIKNRTNSYVNLTGCSNSDLEQHIQKSRPVAVWGTFIGFKVHCMLLVGYDSENYYFNDPWTGRSAWPLDKATFNKHWEALGKLAVSY